MKILKDISTFLGFFIIAYLLHYFLYNINADPVLIKIYNDRFEPALVNISYQTPVTFINESSLDVWPASDMHPTHRIYSEFDPLKPLKPGETWSFTFNKVGEWGVHDHLKPHKIGRIIVSKDSFIKIIPLDIFRAMSFTVKDFVVFYESVRSLFVNNQRGSQIIGRDTFLELSEKNKLSALEILLEEKGSAEVWDFIKETYPVQTGTNGPVHDLAHFAGQLIFKEQEFSGFYICTSEYAFGCYHGFLDVAFENSLKDLSKAEEACKESGPPGSGPNASCIHGIGHGIASYYNVIDLESSLLACNRLTQGYDYCYDGVFMEFGRETADSFYNSEDPLYPCNIAEEKYVYSCGRNQVDVMQNRFGMNFQEITKICSSTESKLLQNSCFEALGFQAAYMASTSPPQIFKLCGNTERTDLQATCATAAAGELIFQNMPGWQVNAPKVCEMLSVPYTQECHTRINQIQHEYRR